jgi:hypothetical protein
VPRYHLSGTTHPDLVALDTAIVDALGATTSSSSCSPGT